MGKWYVENGPKSDVVLSSRVRIARNLSEFPFPFKMEQEDAVKLVRAIKDDILKSKQQLFRGISFFDIGQLDQIDRKTLVEKHLISPDLAESKIPNGVLITEDEKISIMLNEEDHLRLQCIFPGMQIEKAWELCNKIDTILGKKNSFAFNERFGFLTCCPTNIGTGLRISTMLHLPALVMTGNIKGILEACSKLGIAVRGLYGENSETLGNMFQISNQVTLGQSEEEIVENVRNITEQIIDQERLIRSELKKQNPYKFEDKIFRSLGIFENARILSSDESLKLLSDVRLGVDMGIINSIDKITLNEIMLYIQPANLQKLVGEVLAVEERDIKRAEIIREKLTQKRSG